MTGPYVPPLPAPGTRIALVSMPGDPDPVKPGTKGTVVRIAHHSAGTSIEVDWDDGTALGLVVGTDTWRVLFAGDEA